MKLRMLSNSIRLRLTRSEVKQVADTGTIEQRIEFPNDSELIYGLECRDGLAAIHAQFENGRITVYVPSAMAKHWALTPLVGMESQGGRLAILIEKDFQCVHGEPDPDAYEGPASSATTGPPPSRERDS